MIKFEYISVPITSSVSETMDVLKAYGETGWKLAAMYNGYMFFERQMKIEFS